MGFGWKRKYSGKRLFHSDVHTNEPGTGKKTSLDSILAKALVAEKISNETLCLLIDGQSCRSK